MPILSCLTTRVNMAWASFLCRPCCRRRAAAPVTAAGWEADIQHARGAIEAARGAQAAALARATAAVWLSCALGAATAAVMAAAAARVVVLPFMLEAIGVLVVLVVRECACVGGW